MVFVVVVVVCGRSCVIGGELVAVGVVVVHVGGGGSCSMMNIY